MTFNQKKSLIAFYISKYSDRAYKELGYNGTWTDAIADMSRRITGPNIELNSYIKRRRDEFDVFFDNGRAGYRNRKPTVQVIEMYQQWNVIGYNDITDLVKEVLSGNFDKEDKIELISDEEEITEGEIEAYFNFKDNSAALKSRMKETQERLYSRSKVEMLKRLYAYRCQICGKDIGDDYKTQIAEAHHIKYFSFSVDNSSNNLLIVCPNHHCIIHKLNPEFDYDKLEYVYSSGKRDKVILNFHLKYGRGERR